MQQNKTVNDISITDERLLALQDAHGPVLYNMTNDYLFRAVLQTNHAVLKGLVCSLLHLDEEEVTSLNILNPIELGKQIDKKEFHFDVKVELNNNTNINLEMQVRFQDFWVERSLGYLCRTYDSLNAGDNYKDSNTAIHIGIIDFDLFPDYPEFYAKYRLINEKNMHTYTSKFQLNVLDLRQIELATEEDKKYKIDYWARFFKAKTGEEIKVLAAKYPIIADAAVSIREMTEEEQIRALCETREDYDRIERTWKFEIAELQKAKDSLQKDKDSLLKDNDSLQKKLDDSNVEKSELLAKIAMLEAQLEARS